MRQPQTFCVKNKSFGKTEKVLAKLWQLQKLLQLQNRDGCKIVTIAKIVTTAKSQNRKIGIVTKIVTAA